jgi:hypothetical protein
MPLTLQHLLVLLLVVACVALVARQAVVTLRGRGKLGSCCSKGCSSANPAKPPADRVVFLPADMLTKRR